MKPKTDARAGLLAGLNAGAVQAEADRRMADAADRGKTVGLVPAAAILPRHGSATRPARPGHVLALAESIAALGLLSPLTLDSRHRLVAGLHRLEALRLLLNTDRAGAIDGLNAEEKARLAALPPVDALPEPLRAGLVPVRILTGLDSAEDAATALAAEAAENTARRQYTPAEISELADRLRVAGFRDADGRPRKGEKALKPALAVVLGVDVSTVRRILNRPEKPAHVSGFSTHAARLARGLASFIRQTPGTAAEADAIRAATALAEKLNNLH
jgi:ParB family chromosome partitioning protein